MKLYALVLASLMFVSCRGTDEETVLVPVEETETPSTPTPTPEVPVTPEEPEEVVNLSSLYECNGGGNDGTFYTATVETYSNAATRVYLTISSNTVFKEDFEFNQSIEEGLKYTPWPSSMAEGTPLTSMIVAPLSKEFQNKFMVNESAKIFVQLRRSANQGGFYLFVGQTGDQSKGEYIGLNPYGCWSVLQ